MNTGIITVRDHEYHPNQRLIEAAAQQGHRVTLIHPYRVWPCLEGGKPYLVGHSDMEPMGVVLPRQGATLGDSCLALIHHLSLMGIPVVNDLNSVRLTKNKFFTSAETISAILLGISLLGTIFNPSLLFYILAVLFSILAVLSGIFKFQFVRDRSWLAGVLERNKLALSKFGLDAGNIKGIFSNIQKFDEECRKKNDELQETKRGEENLKIKM